MFRNLGKKILTIVLGIYAFMTVYPVIWLLLNSFKKTGEIVVGNNFSIPTHLEISNYYKALFEHNVLGYFVNSIFVTACTIILTLTVSIMLAYALARMQWKSSQLFYTYFAVGLLVPSQAVIIPIFIIMKKLHLINNPLSLILSVSAFNIAISVVVVYGFLRGIPNAMEEAAVIDGCGLRSILIKIIVPMIKPAIATIAIIVFLSSWNEFIFAMLFISKTSLKTLPIGLLSFVGQYGTDWGAMFAAMAVTSLLPIVVFLLFNTQIEKALTAGSILK